MFMHTRHPLTPRLPPPPQHNEADADAGQLDPQRGGADRELRGGVSRRETSVVWVCQVFPS